MILRLLKEVYRWKHGCRMSDYKYHIYHHLEAPIFLGKNITTLYRNIYPEKFLMKLSLFLMGNYEN